MLIVLKDFAERHVSRNVSNCSTEMQITPLDFSVTGDCLIATWRPGAQIFFTKEETDDLKRVLGITTQRQQPARLPTQL